MANTSRIQNSLQDKVLQFIRNNNLISKGDTVIVAVSGGPDSVCLLHILASIQQKLGIKIHIAHLDHQLRKGDSEKDARYVRNLAGRLHIPATIEKYNVAEYHEKNRISVEEAAREVRYRFLTKILKKEKASCVITGHTLNDNLETIMMHIIRGTGLNGLQGMLPVSIINKTDNTTPLKIVRPLLKVSRDETESYCKRHGLKPRLDVSNESLDFLRNRIRLELLPLLQGYNPGFNESLLRLSALARENMTFMNLEADLLWKKLAHEDKDIIYLHRKKLSGLQTPLRNHIIRKAIEKLTGSLKDIEAIHIDDVAALLTKPSGKSLHLPHEIRVYSEHDKLLFTCNKVTLSPFPSLKKNFNIKIPGETLASGWRIRTDIIDKPVKHHDQNLTAYFDREKTGAKLTIRKRKTGDTFMPLGMKKLKKVQDFMVDSKIPLSWRSTVPLLCNDDTIMWVVGWRIDERFKITAATNKILRITFEKVP